MSRLIAGISGVLALSLISGAAEFALGRDLPPAAEYHAPEYAPMSSSSPVEGAPSVNRGSKADRAAGPAGSPALTRTVSLQLEGLSDTTFLIRVPVAASTHPATPFPARSSIRRPMVACEPVVSVLTEVAKQLEPGRCVA
jgi:hypothetical protein